MRPKTIKGWSAAIKRHEDAVAAERDKLDELMSDISELRECCAEAAESLELARDRLSELV